VSANTLHLPTVAQRLLKYCARHHVDIKTRDNELYLSSFYVIHADLRRELNANKAAVIAELLRRPKPVESEQPKKRKQA